MKTADLVSFPARPCAPFPIGGRRVLIYVVYDRRGDVERYIPFALEHLREHCDLIIAVVNGHLTDEGRRALEPVADEIVVRENDGFDIWGYKTGLDTLGDRIEDFHEVVLANDTWFGPVRPFGPVFDRMDAHALHFWGMTDHLRVEPHPFTQTGYLPYHVQSYWMAVRREMFLSAEWKRYWAELPPMSTYSDAVVLHEGVFTERFTGLGFTGEVAFPTLTAKIENHAVLYAEQLLDAGCPTLKRRPFFQWPPFLDQVAVIGRWTLDSAAKYGYPTELIYEDLARNVEPRVLNADAAMLEVMPDIDLGFDPTRPLRTLVVAHIFYVSMAAEMLQRAEMLPGAFDLIVTTPDPERAAEIEGILAARPARGAREVRVVASNNGRDQSAFLVGCRDALLDGGYELVVKLHSKKTPQDAFNVGRHFREQQFENLLHSAGQVANVVALFQREPGLGLAYPPTIHLGHPTMGHGWWSNKVGVGDLCARLGVRVPLDDASPLAPYGSMFFARPEALRLLVEHEWTYDDFGGADAYTDGGLAHLLERMPSYAAGELGYHTRTIATPEYLASSYPALDFDLDQMSFTTPESTMYKIQFFKRAGRFTDGTLAEFVRMYVRLHRPGDEERLDGTLLRSERLRGFLWRLRHPRWAVRSRHRMRRLG